MEKFRFLNWKVYQEARELFKEILKLTKKIPKEHQFGLRSQIIRSTLSIILNIAEGSGKSSERELNKFFDISLGSIHETVAAIDVLRDSQFITKSEFESAISRLQSISKQLGGFKKVLRT